MADKADETAVADEDLMIRSSWPDSLTELIPFPILFSDPYGTPINDYEIYLCVYQGLQLFLSPSNPHRYIYCGFLLRLLFLPRILRSRTRFLFLNWRSVYIRSRIHLTQRTACWIGCGDLTAATSFILVFKAHL
jgi:hypothetical protein